jgi:hypothetical protein
MLSNLAPGGVDDEIADLRLHYLMPESGGEALSATTGGMPVFNNRSSRRRRQKSGRSNTALSIRRSPVFRPGFTLTVKTSL